MITLLSLNVAEFAQAGRKASNIGELPTWVGEKSTRCEQAPAAAPSRKAKREEHGANDQKL